VEPTVPWKIRIMFHGDRPYAVRDREASYREFSRSALQRPEALPRERSRPPPSGAPRVTESDESLSGASTKSHAGVHEDGPMQCLAP
jgi:hypothetical protein